MKPERLLVVTSAKGRSRAQVWDTRSPLGVGHPFRWVLERKDEGVWIRDLHGNAQSVKLGEGASEEIRLDGELSVKLAPVRNLRAAYSAQDLPATETMPALLAFSGVRRSLISCQAIHSAYVAYAKSRPVFTVHRDGEGFKIKTLLGGTRLKLKGEEAVQADAGHIWSLTPEQFVNATLLRRGYWWRFSLVPAAAPLPKSGPLAVDDEQTWFLRALKVTGAVCALLVAALLFWPAATLEEKEEEKKAVVVKLQPLKRATSPVKDLPAPPVATVARKKAVREEVPLPQKVVPKQEAPKLASTPPAPVKKAPTGGGARKAPAKVEKSNPSSLAKVQSLKSALSGAMSLVKRTTVADSRPGAGASADAKQYFNDAPGAALRSTEVKAGTGVVGNTRIGSIGGKGVGSASGAGGSAAGEGVGYSAGAAAGSAGKAGAFVSLGGGTVEEGLSKAEVGRVIHAHMGEVRYCHESAMVYQPKLQGKVEIVFTIAGDGKVNKANIGNSTLSEPQLENCILSKLKAWKFPKPKGGVNVTVAYPFLFKTLGRE